MKKILLTIFVTLVFGLCHSQTYYKAFKSEWSLYNFSTEKWELQKELKDLDIRIVVYEDVINIQAMTPTMYRLDIESKKNINGEKYIGYRYSGVEYTKQVDCTVDLVKLLKDRNSKLFILSITYEDRGNTINMSYYCEPLE